MASSSEPTVKTGASPVDKRSFSDLFTREEIAHYSVAAVIYILLGLWLKDIVLNWVVGPAYIVAWMWIMPPLVKRARRK